MIHRARNLAAWAAILAMALQALWPLIAQARPRSATLVPICTVDGVTHYYELKDADTPLEKRSATHHDHCAFCSFDSGRTAALASAPGFSLPSFESEAPAEQQAVSAAPAYRYPPAFPRAPPDAVVI
jgi:hypothetical protein